MRKPATITATAVGALMVLGGASTAFAAESPAPSRLSMSAMKSPRPSAGATHQSALQAWQAAREAERAARTQVNSDFKAAVDKAQAGFQTAIAAAKTAGDKAAAVMARRSAITNAITRRQEALKAVVPAGPRP
ncbi:MAG: hypothetical protein WC005_07655 [Candidatus Nanopelagicales bacterium]